MKKHRSHNEQRATETDDLRSFVKNLGIDLVGIADLKLLEGMPFGIPFDSESFLKKYPSAIVMGAQLGKLGKKASGKETALFLEKTALEVMCLLEEKGYRALTIHWEDEFDPVRRMGFMSLKVLAKGAGLGWQGRSLVIVSPEYGPIHRLIAVLTNMDLQASDPVRNQCDGCSICVDKCPTGALTLMTFEDHPESRDDVLNVGTCLGDHGCDVCLVTCPWGEKF